MPQALTPTREAVPGAGSRWRAAFGKIAWRAPNPVLVEQLRLVHANATVSFGATFIAAVLTAWLLMRSAERPALLMAWLVAVGLWCGAAVWLSTWVLHARQPHALASRANALTFALYTSYGALWGTLSWLPLDWGLPLHTIWLACVVTGVLTGGMTFMAPLLPTYVGFALLLVMPLSVNFAVREIPGLLVLSAGAILILLTVLGQALRTSQSLRNMIELRFANEALLEELRVESARYQQAQASAEAARHEAERAQLAAVAANLAKSKFLAAASHDLRQPIHAQGLFLEVLAGTPLTVFQVEVLASARVASRASAEMLNTLLDFSRIEAGVVKPYRQPFAMQTVLHKIENDLAPLADAKSLAYRSPETAAVVDGDAALIAMILRNLISNAIRYTEHGGVLIACRRRSGMLVVEVRDTGIGIAPEHQEEVFREFHQLGNPERDQRKGLGLGLAIAQGLANVCGHPLSLSSRLGRGSVFRLTLPLTSVAAVQEVQMPASEHGAPELQGVRVLVLDDDEAVRAGMAQLLRSWGCVCEAAETIGAAEALARQHRPSVFITDYRLREEQTGTAAIAVLRALLGPELPALMITGDTEPTRLREAIASGVPLLHKPVLPEQLLQALLKLAPAAREYASRIARII